MVKFKIETQGHKALEEREVTAHEAPLASFDEALEGLRTVARSIVELKDSKLITVYRMDISYTKHGTKSAQLYFVRVLQATEAKHPLKTPVFQFEDPAEGEQGKRQCTKAEAKAIELMLTEAERYINGERQQMLLPIDAATGESAPEDGDKQDPDLLTGTEA